MGKEFLVTLIGYSQTGKTTRNECIRRHLSFGALDVYRFTRIYAKANGKISNQTRDLVPHIYRANFHETDLRIVSIDYTGQDHIATYYYLKALYQLIDAIEKKQNLQDMRTVYETIIGWAEKFLKMFLDPSQGLKKDEIIELVKDPFKPFENVLQPNIVSRIYSEAVMNSIAWLNPSFLYGDISQSVNEFVNIFNNIINQLKINDISIIELNIILCAIDTFDESSNKFDDNCKNINTIQPEFGISIDIININVGKKFYLRGLLTGPLLMYLFIGFLLKSNIVFFLAPVNVIEWYKQLYNIYQGFGGTLEDIVKVIRSGEGSKIFGRICADLLIDLRRENSETVLSDDDIEKTCDKESYDDIKKTILGQIFKSLDDETIDSLFFGRITKFYHYELLKYLIDITNKIRKYCNIGSSGQSIVIDATYSDNMNVMDIRNKIRNDNDINSIISRLYGEKQDVYLIPSTIKKIPYVVTECTPFEAITIICKISPIATVSLRNPNNNRADINCNDFLDKIRYSVEGLQ